MENQYLISKIPIKAKILVSPYDLKVALDSHPLLKQINTGLPLRYATSEERGHFYIIEFSKQCVTISVYAKDSPLYYMQETILNILCIFAFLENKYEPHLPDLYSYLIYLLHNTSPHQKYDDNHSPTKEETRSDIILAKRISILLRENTRVTGELSDSKKKLSLLLSKFIRIKYGDSIDLDLLSKDIRMSKDEIESLLKQAEGPGLKIRLYRNKLSVVRL